MISGYESHEKRLQNPKKENRREKVYQEQKCHTSSFDAIKIKVLNLKMHLLKQLKLS